MVFSGALIIADKVRRSSAIGKYGWRDNSLRLVTGVASLRLFYEK
jgi:hypothetical protein